MGINDNTYLTAVVLSFDIIQMGLKNNKGSRKMHIRPTYPFKSKEDLFDWLNRTCTWSGLTNKIAASFGSGLFKVWFC